MFAHAPLDEVARAHVVPPSSDDAGLEEGGDSEAEDVEVDGVVGKVAVFKEVRQITKKCDVFRICVLKPSINSLF